MIELSPITQLSSLETVSVSVETKDANLNDCNIES